MARHIKQKLHSDAGLTILLALFGFLFASIVSFTIVTVALSNQQRLEPQQREQRDYLALNSAAALLRDSLADQSVTIYEEFNEDGWRIHLSYSNAGGAGGSLAESLVRSTYESGAENLGALSVDAGEKTKKVKAELHFSGGGTLKMTLRFDGAEDGATAPVTISYGGLHPVVIRDETEYRTDADGIVHFVRHEREQRVTFAADAFHVSVG